MPNRVAYQIVYVIRFIVIAHTASCKNHDHKLM